jgi:hypothetical protein
MSRFLVAQAPVPDALAAIAQHPTYTAQAAAFAERIAAPIPPSLFIALLNALRRAPKPFDPTALGDAMPALAYTWTQRGGTITVAGPWCPEFADADLAVTEDGVQSPVISGAFFGSATAVAVAFTDDKTRFRIELTVANTWPILIIGGERIDAVSLFYLAVFASGEGMAAAMEPLLIASAAGGFVPGISALANHYAEQDRPDAAFFWFAKFAELTHDANALLVPAQILVNNGTKSDALLAESIFVALARAGSGNAFYMLGCLHMTETHVFNADAALAARYLEHAVAVWGDGEAKKALAVLLYKGRGVEKDVPRAIQLLREAGEPEEHLRRLLAGQTETQPPEVAREAAGPEDGAPSLLDWALVGGIFVATLCASVYLAFRLFRRHR